MWRALHIFYYDHHDELLYNGIFPIIKKYKIKKFFFIRYWEQGPHIRLRINMDDNVLFEKIKKDIENYISLHRSEVVLSEKHYANISGVYAKKEKIDNIASCAFIPNNVVCEMEYVPETVKYHGDRGVAIAEEEFCFSSLLALNVIGLNGSKSNKLCYGAAYAMALVDTVLENNEERLFFFELYRRYWENFSEITDQSREQMCKSIESVNSVTIRKIEQIYSRGSANFHQRIFEDIGGNFRTKFDFLMNFIHLFNNRIGVIPYEEIEATLICEKIVRENNYEKI